MSDHQSWYELRRVQMGDPYAFWSVPLSPSPEEALRYITVHNGFKQWLTICDSAGDFVLAEYGVLPSEELPDTKFYRGALIREYPVRLSPA
ncbi:hypothetical protein FXB41_13000 [Bradyrhizobium canariense]|uniref:hypothetical protein n=1 Tax=Bradyrhizobium canariense TaxID=255045 RepID=UPI001CA4A972|nr:hypothetical protein [Bradyrhizobium canariense]MBW5435668.1 hypothetical protein [Bradyrhizobium canariense]